MKYAVVDQNDKTIVIGDYFYCFEIAIKLNDRLRRYLYSVKYWITD